MADLLRLHMFGEAVRDAIQIDVGPGKAISGDTEGVATGVHRLNSQQSKVAYRISAKCGKRAALRHFSHDHSLIVDRVRQSLLGARYIESCDIPCGVTNKGM